MLWKVGGPSPIPTWLWNIVWSTSVVLKPLERNLPETVRCMQQGPKWGLIGPKIRQTKNTRFWFFLFFCNAIMGLGGFNYSKMAN